MSSLLTDRVHRIASATALRRDARVRVLLDEAHQQAWSARGAVAARMNPAHPGDSSYVAAAAHLADREFVVDVHTAGLLDDGVLAEVDVLVLPHGSDPMWESTIGVGSPRYSAGELDAIVSFVARGGGLVVLAETEQAKYGNNLAALSEQFGITLDNATVQDYGANHGQPTWVPLLPVTAAATDPTHLARQIFHGVNQATLYRAGTLRATGVGATVLATTAETSTHPGAGLLAVATHGAGRVVVCADSDLLGDDCLADGDNAQLWLNLMFWVAMPAFSRATLVPRSRVLDTPAWHDLWHAVTDLAAMQTADGALAEGHTVVAAEPLVRRMQAAVTRLIPRFPYDSAYLSAVVDDLECWLASGCSKPDFGASLAAFQPAISRNDDVEHLVLFPMYAPNGTTNKVFELLLVRGPWPTWLADIESSGWTNHKFVPVRLLGFTAGYDSECAVLFPETVTVAGKAGNDWGGIFCDREAERFRRVCGSAVEALRLDLPTEARALLVDEQMSFDTYLLWDLVHDRAHSRGDLPFDPFIVRQRLPFWMYSLEELRCDLTTFVQVGELAEKLPFARLVRYAILLDRMLRFPVTGSRVRNYDGLGGQVLFGFVHARNIVRWTNNTLVVDWDGLPGAIADLLGDITALYRHGIDSTRVRYWLAAWDLVAQHVQPTLQSQFAAERRWIDAPSEDDGKSWVDRVAPDEFPLNLFFRSLSAKVAEAMAARPAGNGIGAAASVGA